MHHQVVSHSLDDSRAGSSTRPHQRHLHTVPARWRAGTHQPALRFHASGSQGTCSHTTSTIVSVGPDAYPPCCLGLALDLHLVSR